MSLEIIPEPEWKELVKELIKHKGTALLLGATDSGKSTLARYLIRELVSKDIKVSLVDSDIGQSSLGLPGTISMKTFSSPEEIEEFNPEKIFFVGTFNPAKKIHLMIDGTKRMADFSKANSEVVLIDTTGLISGEVGIALKNGKIKTIKPEHIIALQRYDELEHIITLIEDIHIHRIKASRMAKNRSRESRIRYRKEKFNDYFNKPEVAEFLLNDATFFYNGKPFRPKEMDFKEGTLIGLNHNEDTKALGILVEIAGNSITFKSPIKSVRGINRVVLGDITIDASNP